MRMFTRTKDIDYIVNILSTPAILGQVAEEADELGQAALKLQRILMDENPTPVTEPEAKTALIEEIADVFCCLEAIVQKVGISYTLDIDPLIPEKARRWAERILEKLEGVPDINVGDKKPMPLSFGEVKALNGEKVYIAAFKPKANEKLLYAHFYGSKEMAIEVVDGDVRTIIIPLSTYGSKWAAYRQNPERQSREVNQ